MDTFPNECIYSILLFLGPKHLQLCGQVNNNFNGLCQLESLWRNQIEDRYNVLFKKESYYENCKLYYRLYTYKRNLKLPQEIEQIIAIRNMDLKNDQISRLPEEIKQLIKLAQEIKD